MICSKPSANASVARFLGTHFARFLVANVFGLTVDVLIAWSLTTWTNVSVLAAADISLIAVAIVMYFVHEFWTFHDPHQRFSIGRMTGVILSTVFAFAIRSSSLYASSSLLRMGNNYVPLQILLAAGLSFLCSFVIVRSIFRRRSKLDQNL